MYQLKTIAALNINSVIIVAVSISALAQKALTATNIRTPLYKLEHQLCKISSALQNGNKGVAA